MVFGKLTSVQVCYAEPVGKADGDNLKKNSHFDGCDR